MVRVTLLTGADGRIQAFESKGHAQFGAYGQDIVCAAVSVATQAAIMGLQHFLGPKVRLQIREGYLKAVLAAELTAEEKLRAETILETMNLTLQSIQTGYRDHLRITRRRWTECS